MGQWSREDGHLAVSERTDGVHSVVVGDTAITWHLRYSTKARRKRIVVTPAGVEVVAPQGAPMGGVDGIEAFVRSKRRWIYDAVRKVEHLRPDSLEQHYASGAKMVYRGRRLLIEVQPADVDQAVVDYRSRFHVRVPRSLDPEQQPAAVREALLSWMMQHAHRDAVRWSRLYGDKLGVKPKIVRLGNQKTLWGSCSGDGALRINWRLVQAPAAAMEYVVAHEVVHLVERNHSERFWSLLGQILPDWVERKALLQRWEREQQMQGREV